MARSLYKNDIRRRKIYTQQYDSNFSLTTVILFLISTVRMSSRWGTFHLSRIFEIFRGHFLSLPLPFLCFPSYSP